MAIDLLAESNELQNISLNNEIYSLALRDFLSKVKTDLNLEKYQTPEEKLERLKIIYIYMSEHLDMFFEILKKYNYYMKKEIKNAAFWLMHLPDYNNNKELIKKLLKSPVIQDISFSPDHKFKIHSQIYGDFIFQPADYYFSNTDSIIDYMQQNTVARNCHNNTYFMSELFGDFYSITSVCRSPFLNHYHHSYTYDPENDIIIDLCYKAVFEKKSYYDIFCPTEISVILNTEIDRELEITSTNTCQPQDRHHLLRIALYKEYLQKIGYTGSFEDAPNLR